MAREINRSDNWTEKEDEFLVEMILKHVREGSTQLRAFDEAGREIERTPGACGFRWNKELRHNYTVAFRTAKRTRLGLSQLTHINENKPDSAKSWL